MSTPPIEPTEPPADARRVCVVVVTWNAADLVRECLAALVEQRAAAWDIEIVVVDNGSTDDTVDAVRSAYRNVQIVALPRNVGFAAAANAGIAASDAPFVVLVNNDAVCAPDFVAAILAPFERADSERLGAVTGRIVLASKYRLLDVDEAVPAGALTGFDGRRWVPTDDTDPRGIELLNSTGGEVTRSGNGRDRDWLTPASKSADSAASREVFGFCGGAAALRRAALDDVGLFDPRLFLYYEDTDLSWRLRRRGWQIEYAADAVVRHRHAASSGTRSDFFLRHNERNRLIVALRNAPMPVVMRALARAAVHSARDLARGRGLRRHAATWLDFLRQTPRVVRARRYIERRATVSRGEVARLLVADGLVPDGAAPAREAASRD